MTTEQRDKFASHGCMFIPLALDEINTAERLITEGKATEALKWLREAREHLNFLTPLFNSACQEASS